MDEEIEECRPRRRRRFLAENPTLLRNNCDLHVFVPVASEGALDVLCGLASTEKLIGREVSPAEGGAMILGEGPLAGYPPLYYWLPLKRGRFLGRARSGRSLYWLKQGAKGEGDLLGREVSRVESGKRLRQVWDIAYEGLCKGEFGDWDSSRGRGGEVVPRGP